MKADATGDRRRLAVCLFVAAALHAVVLLTIEGPGVRGPHPLPTINVALGQAAAPRPDEDAATNNTIDVPLPPLAPALSRNAPGPSPVPVEPRPEPGITERETAPPRSVLTDTPPHDLARAIVAQARDLSAQPHGEPGGAESSPRVRRLAAAPSHDPDLAYYLDSWRRKVQRVGNINYPREARSRGLSGTLRLLVVIGPDGELHDVRVLASSGHELLDEGAVGIVHLAAPFSPFTRSMRTRIDLLEIERTWRFRKDRLTHMP